MTNRTGPTFSICIPTYNRVSYLGDAIRSCLAQTDQDFEICISSNASTDRTPELIDTYCKDNICFFHHPKPVLPYENWNTALTMATGEYVLFLSDDDLLKPGYLSEIRELIGVYPSASLYRTGLSCIDEHGKEKWSLTDYPDFESPIDFIKARCISNRKQFLPGITSKRQHISDIHGFVDNCMPAMLYLDDYFWFRLVVKGTGVASSPKALWSYRQHGEQYGGKPIDMRSFAANARIYSSLLHTLVSPIHSDSDFNTFLGTRYADKIVESRLIHEYNRFATSSKMVVQQECASLADTLFIICNGPSLTSLDYSSLGSLNTVCMNYSYRLTGSMKWKPKYYVCTDLPTLHTIKHNFKDLISSLPPTAYIFIPHEFKQESPVMSSLERCIPIDKLAFPRLSTLNIDSSSLLGAIYMASSEGFRKIVLVGADLFYCKEEINALYNIDDSHGQPVMTRKVSISKKKEYNYSHKNYHRIGDSVSYPNSDHLRQGVMQAYYRLASIGVSLYRLEGMPSLLEDLPSYPNAILSMAK